MSLQIYFEAKSNTLSIQTELFSDFKHVRRISNLYSPFLFPCLFNSLAGSDNNDDAQVTYHATG